MLKIPYGVVLLLIPFYREVMNLEEIHNFLLITKLVSSAADFEPRPKPRLLTPQYGASSIPYECIVHRAQRGSPIACTGWNNTSLE